MLRYEVLFLTVPEITADETSSLESNLDKLVRSHKGTVLSCDRWGKLKLSYPIRDFGYGVYFLARFEVANENLKSLLEELRTFFAIKNAELVMRDMICVLDKNKSLDYQKPELLDETSTRDVDAFLKENKMSGLVSRHPKHVDNAPKEQDSFENQQ